jgi:hypothetical protein
MKPKYSSKAVSAFKTLALATIVGGFLIAQASAILTVDLRVVSVSGGSTSNTKTANVNGNGSIVTLALWGIVTGTNGIVDENISIVSQGILISSPGTISSLDTGVSGNSSLPASPNTIFGTIGLTIDPLFLGSGAVVGKSQDLDGDGDLDMGGTSTANATDYISFRSTSPSYTGSSSTEGVNLNTLANGREFLLGTVTFTITTFSADGSTALNWMWRSNTTEVTRASFNSDGGSAENGADANLAVGNYVSILAPEPSTFAMLLGGLGILIGFNRRRR